ncbi:MAG TPA: TolC family protein [Opitutaceae bacterium]
MLATAAAGLAARADTTNAPRELSLQAAIESALARNFELRINRQEPVIAEGQLEAARGAYDPTLSVGVERAHDESPALNNSAASVANSTTATASVDGLLSTGATYTIAGNVTSSSVRPASSATQSTFTSYEAAQGTLAVIEITQPLLKNRKIDSARLAVGQNKLALRAAELVALQQAMTTVANVEQAYFTLLAARETVRVNESALQLAEQSLADTRNRIRIGSLSALDEKDAQSLVASNRADLLAAQQAVREAENALLALVTDAFADWRQLGLAPTDTLSADTVAIDYSAILSRALANRPELEYLELTREQQELNVRFQENQRLPSLNLVGSYGLQGADTGTSGLLNQWRDGDHPYYTVGVTVSVPWRNRTARGNTTAAKGREEQARLALEQEREAILSEVDTAIAAVRSSLERIAATREASAYARAALDAEQRKLASGTSTTFTVLQLQRNLVSAQADEIQALADYNKALSILRLREGTTLEYWRVKFAGAPASASNTRFDSTPVSKNS